MRLLLSATSVHEGSKHCTGFAKALVRFLQEDQFMMMNISELSLAWISTCVWFPLELRHTCFLLDHGPLAKIISFRGTHLGNTWFMVYLKDISLLGILQPKKVPKQKTCQILRKRVICDYLLSKCITEQLGNLSQHAPDKRAWARENCVIKLKSCWSKRLIF